MVTKGKLYLPCAKYEIEYVTEIIEYVNTNKQRTEVANEGDNSNSVEQNFITQQI